MTPGPPDPAAFRARATAVFVGVLAALVAAAAGYAWLGWRLGGGWGPVAGAVLGLLGLALGLPAAAMIWAMSQDSR